MEKLCPLLKKPCIQHSCMLWKQVNFERAGMPVVEWDCSLNWNMTLQMMLLNEQKRTSAVVDKLATETQAAAGTLIARQMGLLK